MHTHMEKICGDREMKCSSFRLPEDVMIDIFLRLEVKNLARLRCVCKSWNTLLTSKTFVEIHLNQSMRNPRPLLFRHGISPSYLGFYSTKCKEFEDLCDPPFRTQLADLDVVGSCNGVLCFCSNGSDRSLIYLWNPLIKKYITLPRPSLNPRYLGFGVNSVSGHLDDFKVVTISANADAEVYSLRSNSWKNIAYGFPRSIEINRSHINSSVFLNGSVHWCARFSCYHDNSCPWLIVSFDFAKEIFQTVMMPYDLSTDDADKYLNVFDGYLCVFATIPNNTFRSYELWVMKEYGLTESWTKLYTIEKPQRIWWPLGFTERGKIFIRGECRHGGYGLLVYNPHSDTFKCIGVHLPYYAIQVLNFVESIIEPVSQSLILSRS